MRLLGKIFVALAVSALAAPASAQMFYGGGMMRGPMHGGGIGMGILGGVVGGAIVGGAAASAAQPGEPPSRLRHPPRKKVVVQAKPRPEPKLRHVEPQHRIARQPEPKQAEPKHMATKQGAAAPAALLNLPPAGETRFLAKEVLVVFRPGTSDSANAALARRLKIESSQFRDLALLNERVYRFRYSDDRPLDEVMKALAREPAVASVEPHYVYALAQEVQPVALPSPTRALEAPAGAAPPPDYAPGMMHLPEAHRIATGKGVRVALIDSAIDPAHPEIEGSIAASFDATGAAANPSRHGSGMAGAIAGHSQIDGSAPGARLLVAHAFDETPDGVRAVGLDLLASLDWAVAQKAQVVNMSFAGPADPLLQQELAAAAARKIVLIGAAGNDGPNAPPAFPGADPHVIAVSALDGQSRLYDHANRGSYVALAAPGVDVLVAAPGGAYDLTSGTSIACAEVSGIAALLLERNPSLDGAALRQKLRDSAHALKDAPDAGAGLADAQGALR